MLAQLDITGLTYPNTLKKPIFGDDETGDAENPDDFFEQLVLPKGHKDLVKSLIAQHFRYRASAQSGSDQTDIIRGKGKQYLQCHPMNLVAELQQAEVSSCFSTVLRASGRQLQQNVLPRTSTNPFFTSHVVRSVFQQPYPSSH